jgi:protocatechuate 3,4-dioxygenase beta subunit
MGSRKGQQARDEGGKTKVPRAQSEPLPEIDDGDRAAASPHPPYDWPDYVGSQLRHPKRPLVVLPHTLSELTGPVFGDEQIGPLDNDLTRQHEGEPIGERIVVHGRVIDRRGKPLRNTLVEIWQANAAGRYRHKVDNHPAPLDPNFSGAGRCLTDDEGRYRFVTVRPGEYPWRNHYNAWRPSHIHFSLFGRAFTNRLVTQMYFPGDPLLELDPIFHSVRSEKARQALISRLDMDEARPDWSLAYRFDIVLDGPDATWIEKGALR